MVRYETAPGWGAIPAAFRYHGVVVAPPVRGASTQTTMPSVEYEFGRPVRADEER